MLHSWGIWHGHTGIDLKARLEYRQHSCCFLCPLSLHILCDTDLSAASIPCDIWLFQSCLFPPSWLGFFVYLSALPSEWTYASRFILCDEFCSIYIYTSFCILTGPCPPYPDSGGSCELWPATFADLCVFERRGFLTPSHHPVSRNISICLILIKWVDAYCLCALRISPCTLIKSLKRTFWVWDPIRLHMCCVTFLPLGEHFLI